MKYGYERGRGKELDVQSELLYTFGVDRIFTDCHILGLNDWSFLYKYIGYMASGSTLFVQSVYRISNNLDELLQVIDALDAKDIKLVVINQPIETATEFGRAIIALLKGTVAITKSSEESNNLYDITSAYQKIKIGLNRIQKLYGDKSMKLIKK